MSFLKVWCEYDISGSFAGGHEEIFEVDIDLINSTDDIEALLCAKFVWLGEGDLIDNNLLGWEFIEIKSLHEGL